MTRGECHNCGADCPGILCRECCRLLSCPYCGETSCDCPSPRDEDEFNADADRDNMSPTDFGVRG